MCGRFLIKRDPNEVNERFNSQTISEEDFDRLWRTWNAAPTQFLPVIVERTASKREALRLQWGLVPRWQRSDGKPAVFPINARSETMFELPMFRRLVGSRRCIVPMSGYYEWCPDRNGKKRPYYITARDGDLWGVAGLWDDTHRDGSDAAGSFTIVTMPATPTVAEVHPRMPVILTRDREAAWLSADLTNPREIQHLVQPYPETELLIYPVSNVVDDTRNNGPELIEPEAKQGVLW